MRERELFQKGSRLSWMAKAGLCFFVVSLKMNKSSNLLHRSHRMVRFAQFRYLLLWAGEASLIKTWTRASLKVTCAVYSSRKLSSFQLVVFVFGSAGYIRNLLTEPYIDWALSLFYHMALISLSCGQGEPILELVPRSPSRFKLLFNWYRCRRK